MVTSDPYEEETAIDGESTESSGAADGTHDYGAIKLDGEEFVVTNYDENSSSCRRCRFLPHWYKAEAKASFKIALPMVITSLFDFMMGPISLIFCGMLSTEELGGAALAVSVINVFGLAPGQGLASASDTLFSQTYGSSNKKKVGIYLQRSLLIVSLCAIPCWALHLNIGSIFLLIGQEPKIAAIAGEYVVYFIPGLYFNYIYTVLQKYLYNQNIILPTIVFGLIGAAANVVSHIILLQVYDFGTNGSAISQVIAFFTMFITILLYIVFSGMYEETWSGFSMEAFQCWGEYSELAIPGLLMIFLEWTSLEIGTILTGLLNTIQLDSQAITFQVNTIIFMISLGFSIASNIRVGQFLGKGDALSAKRAAGTALSIVCITSTTVCIFVLSLRYVLPRIFTDNSDVIEYTAEMLLPVLACYHILDSFQGVCEGILRGCGRQKIGAFFIFLNYCVIALPVGIPLMFLTDRQSQGMWLGLSVGIVLETISFGYIIIRTDWDLQVTKAQSRAGVATNENEGSSIKWEESSTVDEKTGLLHHANENDKQHEISSSTSHINYTEHLLTTRELVFRRTLLILILLMILAIGVYLHIIFPVGCVEPFLNGTYPESDFPRCSLPANFTLTVIGS